MLPLKRSLPTLRRAWSWSQFSPRAGPARGLIASASRRSYASTGAGDSSSKSPKPTQNGKDEKPLIDVESLQNMLGVASENIRAARAQEDSSSSLSSSNNFNPDTNLVNDTPTTNTTTAGVGNNSNPFVPSDNTDSKVLNDILASYTPAPGRQTKGRRPAPAPPVPSNPANADAPSKRAARSGARNLFPSSSSSKTDRDSSPSLVSTSVRYRLYVLAKRQNTLTTLVQASTGKTCAWATGGRCGFKGVGEGTYEAGYQCAVRMLDAVRVEVARWAKENKTVEVEILVRGFGQGRTALLKALTLPEGDGVRELVYCITDRTQIKIGGVRLQKARRL